MLGFLRTIILCAKLLYRKQTKKRKKRKQTFFCTFLQKTSLFSPADACSPGENELLLCHLSYFAKTRFQLGFVLKTKTNLSQLSSSVSWNINKSLFIQGSLFEVTQLWTSTLKVWETTQVPLSLKVTILIFLVAIKLLMYFHELSSTFNKTWVQGAQFASLNLRRFLWRMVVQEKKWLFQTFFQYFLTYVLRSQLHFDFEYYH